MKTAIALIILGLAIFHGGSRLMDSAMDTDNAGATYGQMTEAR